MSRIRITSPKAAVAARVLMKTLHEAGIDGMQAVRLAMLMVARVASGTTMVTEQEHGG